MRQPGHLVPGAGFENMRGVVFRAGRHQHAIRTEGHRIYGALMRQPGHLSSHAARGRPERFIALHRLPPAQRLHAEQCGGSPVEVLASRERGI
jgi:hypothetical protein